MKEPEDSLADRMSELKMTFYNNQFPQIMGGGLSSPGVPAGRYEDEYGEENESNELVDMQSYQIEDPQTVD